MNSAKNTPMKTTQKINGKKFGVYVLILMVSTLVLIAAYEIRHRMKYAISDAVFVKTDDLVTTSFNGVNGCIVKMTKQEGDYVKNGEMLASIDPETYRLAAEQTLGELNATKKDMEKQEIYLKRLRRDVELGEAKALDDVGRLKNETASLRASEAVLDPVIKQLERDKKRFEILYEAKAIPKRRAEEMATDLASKKEEKRVIAAKIDATLAALRAAKKQVEIVKTRRLEVRETKKAIEAANGRIDALGARLSQERLNLARCELKSPISGRIAQKFAATGDVVSPENPIYAIINPKDIYILVLLEEEKLYGVKRGCTANVSIDAYPNMKFKGVVKDVLPASAATFALVPRDISAGEFTKVSQRIPVKIAITKGDTSLLRVGLGGEVEIKRTGR